MRVVSRLRHKVIYEGFNSNPYSCSVVPRKKNVTYPGRLKRYVHGREKCSSKPFCFTTDDLHTTLSNILAYFILFCSLTRCFTQYTQKITCHVHLGTVGCKEVILRSITLRRIFYLCDPCIINDSKFNIS